MSGAATLNTRQYTEKKVSPDDCSERPKKAMGLHELPQGPGFMELEPSPMPMPVLNNPSGVQHRDIVDEFVAAIQNPGSGSAVQARGLWTSLAERILGSILRRDGTTGDLAARGNFEDFMNAVTSTGSEGTVHSRSFWSQLEEIAAQILRRDVTPDDLAARESAEMATEVLRRDVSPDGLIRRYFGNWGSVDPFLDYVMLNLRDLDPEAGILARSIPDGAAETVARRDAADEFLNALLKTRDSPEITPESLLALASLASRTLDDLD